MNTVNSAMRNGRKRVSRPTVLTPRQKTAAVNEPMPAESKERHRSNSIRILAVDDHPLFRHGLVQLLNSDPGFSVCGECGSAPEALTLIRKLHPDLVIADVGLKGPSGLELTKSIRAEFPKMPVLILSMHDEPTYAVRSLRAGANGYVTKQDALASVLIAVREVINRKELVYGLDKLVGL